MALTQISTEGIKNGTITNNDIGSSAAIAGTKINPSFGSQTISVVSDQTNPSIQISGSGPNFIRFLDSGGDLADSIDLTFRTSSHRLRFENAGNGANILSLDADDKQATFGGNVDIASGLDVTGNTIGTGKLQYTHTGVSNTAHFLFEGTQSTGTNNNGTFFEIKHGRGAGNTNPILDVKNSVGSVFSVTGTGQANMSGNLDVGAGIDVTGNITVSGTVDGRDIASDGSKLDGIESGATADQTASEILTLIKTVDGAGSGLDADTLDGIGSSGFLRANATTTFNASGNDFNFNSDGSRTLIGFQYNGALRWQLKQQSTGENLNFDRVAGSGVFQVDGNRVLTTADEGSGNGIDADTLDGVQGSSYLRSDANDTTTGNLTISKSGATLTLKDTTTTNTEHAIINFDENNNQGVALKHVEHDGDLPVAGYGLILTGSASNTQFPNTGTLSLTVLGRIYTGGTTVGSVHRVLHAADEIGTSNIANDAVTFAKIENIATGGIIGRNNSGTGSVERLTASEVRAIINVENGATADQTAADIRGLGFFDTSNDGSGSGLDSDTVDGIHGASFARSDQDDTMSGSYTLNKDAADVINFSANSLSNNRGIAFNGRTALSAGGSNAWLRLNNNSEFGNGTYTPGLFRADGGFLTGTGSHRLAIKFDGTFSDTSVGHNASHNEGIFWHTTANYGIYRTAGNWSGNYSQLRLDWPTGIVIDGGTSHGLSGCRFDCNTYPTTNNTFDLGTSSLRWRNVYTNDLNLSNEGGSNDIDGTWGSYTIQEGAEDLFLVNKRNGKKYKFNLTEV